MKKIVLTSLLFILANLTIAGPPPFEPSNDTSTTQQIPTAIKKLLGGDSSGGGTCIVYADGVVKFSDLVHVTHINEKLVTQKIDRRQLFWQYNYGNLTSHDMLLLKLNNNNYQPKKQYITPNTTFFDLAIDIFKDPKNANKFYIFNILAESLKSVKTFNSTLQLTNKQEYLSKRIKTDFQELAGVYVNYNLLISKVLHYKMSYLHQQAFSLHEGFRHLNRIERLKKNLTTNEIEIAVRYFLNKSFIEDNFKPVLFKLTQIKANFYTSIIERLTHIQKRIKANDDHILNIRKLTDPLDIGEELSEKNSTRLFKLNQIKISLKTRELHYQQLLVKEILPKLKNTELFFNSVSIDNINEYQLSACFYIDLIEDKIFNRCFE